MQGTITTVVRMALWRVANTQLSFNRRVGDISLYTQLFTRKIHREMFYTIAILLFIIINGKPLSIGKNYGFFFILFYLVQIATVNRLSDRLSHGQRIFIIHR